jgi:transcriptional regulator with XRE-family HTH domain
MPPRPNRPRSIHAEAHLVEWIVRERDARKMTNEGLAKRMTDLGCPMSGSAIFKIEKADPPRRIVVDELVAFARVFDVDVADLLLPPDVAADRNLSRDLRAWSAAADRATRAQEALDEAETEAAAAWTLVKERVQGNPQLTAILDRQLAEVLAESPLEVGSEEARRAYFMASATGDPIWLERFPRLKDWL